jgi:hypothetical protein
MGKTLLITAAIISALLATPALPADPDHEVPEMLRGTWCRTKTDGEVKTYRRVRSCRGMSLTFSRSTITSRDESTHAHVVCQVNFVHDDYLIEMTCGGQDVTWSYHRTHGALVINWSGRSGECGLHVECE